MTVNGFKKYCTSSADDDDDMSSEGSEEDGMVGVSAREIKALTLKMETVTLTGKGGQNTTSVVYFSI
jgi:hypothetical protein